MEEKIKKINLLWLSQKGLLRFRLWFVLKVLIVMIWAFTSFNFFSLSLLQPKLLSSGLSERLFVSLFLILNFVLILFFITLTVLTLKIRQVEFGLYRCGGATRGELFSLILNESLLLILFSFFLLLFVELAFVLSFRWEIAGLFKIVYDFKFILFALKNYILTFGFLFIILVLCYFPMALFYSFKDPYEIVRY